MENLSNYSPNLFVCEKVLFNIHATLISSKIKNTSSCICVCIFKHRTYVIELYSSKNIKRIPTKNGKIEIDDLASSYILSIYIF
jgi:hypothetical protein